VTDQTDFTQIAADFAAALKPVDAPDDLAAVRDATAADDIASDEEGEAVILPGDDIDPDTTTAVGDEAETDETTVSQGSAGPAASEKSLTQEKRAGDADGNFEGGTAHLVGGDPLGTESAETRTDGGIFAEFPAAPRQPGEFKVTLCDLLIGDQSPGGIYDFDSGAGEALLHAVRTPENIAPIVVMKVDNDWHVVDGWARVTAMRFEFGNTANFPVRAIEWNGTHDAGLYNRFAATFLTLKSRKIDKSILLLQFHLAWKVPQLVLGARIGWTESRVTRELAAAGVMLEAPRFAELHVKACDPPIDYLYKVQQARVEAAADDKAHPKRAPEKGAAAKLDTKLEALLAKPERFTTAEALAKLGIGKSDKAKLISAKNEPGDVYALSFEPEAPAIIDCVEDSGGDAVAMVEMGTDQLPSIRLLVDMTTLEDRRRAEVRHLVHEAVDRLLGF
jgi:hypothetical protein